MNLSPALACAGLLTLTACASARGPQAEAVPDITRSLRGEGSAYGMFLAGRAASNAGDNGRAAAFFSEAARLSGSSDVREQAFFSAVMAGDAPRAAALAPQAEAGSPGAVRLGRLVVAVEKLAEGDGAKALASLSGEPVGYPHRAAGALLKPWAAAAAGDWATATAEPELKSDRLAYNLGTLARAQLLERNRRPAEAEAVLKAMSDAGDSSGVFLEARGALLERRGRRAEAMALYDAALAENPDDAQLQAMRARAAEGRRPPPLPTPRQGAAQALVGAAAGSLLLKQTDLGLVYLRLALRLEPQSDEAWMLLGDTLGAAEDETGARAAYAHVSPKSASFVEARTRTIWTYGEKELDTALTLARETAKAAPADLGAQTTLADLLRAKGLYAESAQVLDGVITAAGDRKGWRLYYLRALALDKAGRWEEAERDLKAGLALKPEDATLLNYLGYSWIDRGERLEEALGMIQKALEGEPNSGAIVDSLGWAYFRLGRYDEAVEHLERAAQLEPADAEINSHLGDAYWRNGRRIEAEFQWRKVLTTMSPSPEMKADLEAKLKAGLQASPPAKVAQR